VFTNGTNPRSHVSRKTAYRVTRVRRGATIGANATIVCGITLGEYSFIGAGAVVTSDVPPFALMVGVPARRVGWMCQCGVRLVVSREAATCAACGARYQEENGLLRQIDPPAPRV
jgi:UDP-2-acetamido-3-amino-2,3-dideoxy-glucuronate N-acetyltransferase